MGRLLHTLTSVSAAVDGGSALGDLEQASCVLAEARRGGPAEMERLLDESIQRLRRYAASIGASEPEVAVNDAFLRMLVRQDQLSFPDPPAMHAYLRRTIRNLVIDDARRRSQAELTELVDMAEPGLVGPETVVVERDYVARLLDQLGPAQRQILELRYLEDLSIDETAARTGRTRSAVKKLQHRATQNLRLVAYAVLIALIGLTVILAIDSIRPGSVQPISGERPVETTEPTGATSTAPALLQEADLDPDPTADIVGADPTDSTNPEVATTTTDPASSITTTGPTTSGSVSSSTAAGPPRSGQIPTPSPSISTPTSTTRPPATTVVATAPSIVTTTAIPPTTVPEPPRVQFFPDANYVGGALAIGPDIGGIPDMPPVVPEFDDSISSIHVPLGLSVTVCDLPHGGGTCATFVTSQPSLGPLDNRISYLDVTTVSP